MIGIYKITSPNNRVYIGQSKNLEERLRYYSINSSKAQVLLHRSFKKYGIKNHKFEIVEQCTIEELNNRERYWQEYYNVLEGGLNCHLVKTDELPRIMSDEYKNKIKNTLKAKYKSGELVNARKNIGRTLDIYDFHGNIIKSNIYTEDAVIFLKLANRSIINIGIRKHGFHMTNDDKIVIPFKEPFKELLEFRTRSCNGNNIPLYKKYITGEIKRCTISSKNRVMNKVLNSENLIYYSKNKKCYYTIIGLLNDLPL